MLNFNNFPLKGIIVNRINITIYMTASISLSFTLERYLKIFLIFYLAAS